MMKDWLPILIGLIIGQLIYGLAIKPHLFPENDCNKPQLLEDYLNEVGK